MSPAGKQLVLLLTFISSDLASSAGAAWNSSLKNSSVCGGRTNCIEGVILPIWTPENPALLERLARATVYFLALVYMFLGVSIIADRFMASIEVITSQERKITIKTPGGEKVTTRVRVWNETVSNLTLMALGSSAPEILLSVVEVCGHGFAAGELGPNTIVGSAAFNMFVIIGLCVSVIPEGQSRRVKHLRVFFVTATCSIFAYTWLYLILAVTTPGVVEIWEGLLTLLFFPLCVGVAYVADRRLLFYKYVYKRYRAGKRRGVIVEMEGEPGEGEEPGAGARGVLDEVPKHLGSLKQQAATPGDVLERSSRTGDIDLCSEGPDSFSSTLVYQPEDGMAGAAPGLPVISADHTGIFTFQERTLTISKNVGVMEVKVLRTSGACGVVALPFKTTEGTARGGGENFEDAHGVLEFDHNEIW